MLDYYFSSRKIENDLDNILDYSINKVNSNIYITRFYAEKANIIAQLLPYMKKLNFKISNEVIEVITRNYSKFFLPELTHSSIEQYSNYFEKYYNELISIFEQKDEIKIIDLGCGVSFVYNQILSNIKNISYYECIDFNNDVIEINKLLNIKSEVCFKNANILGYSCDYIFNYALLFNVIKFISCENIKIILKKLFANNKNIKVIISDNKRVVESIKHIAKEERYKYISMDNFFIIYI